MLLYWHQWKQQGRSWEGTCRLGISSSHPLAAWFISAAVGYELQWPPHRPPFYHLARSKNPRSGPTLPLEIQSFFGFVTWLHLQSRHGYWFFRALVEVALLAPLHLQLLLVSQKLWAFLSQKFWQSKAHTVSCARKSAKPCVLPVPRAPAVSCRGFCDPLEGTQ